MSSTLASKTEPEEMDKGKFITAIEVWKGLFTEFLKKIYL